MSAIQVAQHFVSRRTFWLWDSMEKSTSVQRVLYIPLGCVLVSGVSFVHSASASAGFCGCLNMKGELNRAVGYVQSSVVLK